MLSGGFSRNILIRNWLDHTKIKEQLSKPFTEKDLKIDQHPTSYDFSPFLFEPSSPTKSDDEKVPEHE